MDGKQLKNSILQWAIQGKLVPQNPKDEPAQKLLERIAASRNEYSAVSACHPERSAKGTKSKDLKKKTSKNPTSRIYCKNGVWYEQVGTAAPKDISDEIPFEIPESWVWSRLKDAFETSSGSTPLSSRVEYYKNGSVNWVRTTDLNNGILTECEKRIMELAKKDYNLAIIPRESICIAMYGGRGTIGKYALIDFDTTINQSVCAIYPNGFCYSKYIFYYMQFYRPLWMQFAAGSRKDPNINQIIIKNCLIPLPPLAEQKRIVAKLEQVLPLAEEYGAAQEQLDKLNKELPEALKKSILQEAIQGKLVPQNPKDEPASVLLAKIRKEKEALVKQGKLKKKDLESSSIDEEEIPFEIPETWTWCRMGDFITISTGLAYKKEDLDVRAKSYIRVLRGGNIDYGKWFLKDDDVLIAPQFVKDDLILKKGTFITPAVTSLEQMGKTALIESDQKDVVVGGFVLMLSSIYNDEIFLKYILNVFQSYYYKQYCQSITNKSGQAFYNLSRQKLLQCLIPLPPLAEQKRIVAKLEQLFKVL